MVAIAAYIHWPLLTPGINNLRHDGVNVSEISLKQNYFRPKFRSIPFTATMKKKSNNF